MLCGHVMRAETEKGNQSKKRQVLVMCMSVLRLGKKKE